MELRNTSLRLGTATTLAFTSGASSMSSALFGNRGAGIYVVRVQTDQDCHIAVGDNPTASATSTALPAGSVEYFNVCAGEKIATYGKTAAGSVSITEMN